MAAPTIGTYAPWSTQAQIPKRYADLVANAETQTVTDCIQMSSDILYAKSGRRWPGLVSSVTVRPCSRSYSDGSPLPIFGGSYAASAFGYWGSLAFAPWSWDCGCVADVHRGCGCRQVPEITLGIYPLVSVSQVLLDGVAYAGPNGSGACTYRVDDWRYLVRTDGSAWPCCPDVVSPTTAQGTFSVMFSGGQAPPVGGALAAAHLAGEFIGAWAGASTTQLNPRATSVARQNLTVGLISPEDIFDKGACGVPAVDLWLASVNPKQIQRRATISSVDRPRPVRRAGTG